MITFINGRLVQKTPTYVVLDAGGLGYLLKISLYTYEAIRDRESSQLFTSLVIKSENQSVSGFDLYGFATEAERDLFEKMISVSGVGAATARMMLSSFKPEEVQQAIISENEALIQSVKGIGPKMAKRIILELKDKMAKMPMAESSSSATGGPGDARVKDEALYALMALGFQKATIEKVLAKLSVQRNDWTVETLIKEALRNF